METTVKSEYRQSVLRKIAEFEERGWFDRDVEDDPPTRTLMPDEIDYTYSGVWQRIQTRFANFVATTYFDNLIRKEKLIIKAVEGLENYKAVEGGAVITCNHFNPFDNYAVFTAIRKQLRAERRDLYKIIREGNYTTFKGIYGYFFRNCNTLPLSSNFDTLKKMTAGIDTLLRRGEKILIYPEQGMWWNYRKPRPLKDGAFVFAVKSGVPVIPFFITMEDTEHTDAEGYPVQAYTVHIMESVFPDDGLPVRDRAVKMKNTVYEMMKDKYKQVYGEEVTYLCDGE